ncbi:hypothetical protein MmiEs2_11340 [Methanimicrococcus stummii]|uniref:Uncharacterized protein n=1 Tax=Methanimicrococcus stummii TaxID=3028294 RepID=A0AA96VIG8_9EURY|nr:hypothetical protein [Methanimicrococcus sp. Es2]WNY28921.1 hypothetical protein MmiEs2_11340 [Methanimicrococcus sp. Es2]
MNSEFKIDIFVVTTSGPFVKDEQGNRYKIENNIIFDSKNNEIRELALEEAEFLKQMEEYYQTNWPIYCGQYVISRPIEMLGKRN